jgi:hypothetical protein
MRVNGWVEVGGGQVAELPALLGHRFDHPDDPTGPSRSHGTDEAPNVSKPDPTGAVQFDAEHPARNRKVVGSNPSAGST